MINVIFINSRNPKEFFGPYALYSAPRIGEHVRIDGIGMFNVVDIIYSCDTKSHTIPKIFVSISGPLFTNPEVA